MQLETVVQFCSGPSIPLTLLICRHVHAVLQPVHEHLKTTSKLFELQSNTQVSASTGVHSPLGMDTYTWINIYINHSGVNMPKSLDSSENWCTAELCFILQGSKASTHQTSPLSSRVFCSPPFPRKMAWELPAWLGCPMAVAVALLSKAATLLFPPEFNKSFTPPKKANLWSKVEPLSCWCVSKKDEWIFA